MIRSFEDLDAFKRAYRVSLEVHRVSLGWPREEQYGLADQACRSSKSICANLAEGWAKQSHSKAEFNRFIFMAIGSAEEMRVWSRYCFDLGLIDEVMWSRWRDEYQDIAKMLQGLSRQVVGSKMSDP